MPCYHPLKAHKSPKGVSFKTTPDSFPIQLPCGRCIGCRLERSRQWAVRLVHENRQHDKSSFITLTYNEKHLPKDLSLNIKHFQDFMKRLRKDYGKQKLRFFHAGEYGEKRHRPHYHAIIFGADFTERLYEKQTNERGDTTWASPQLDRLWPFGMNRVGSVTFESCAYVARYVTKKVSGELADDHYTRICETTGEIYKLKPEYATMSRRPGIGKQHFDLYNKSIYPLDEVIMRGFPSKPPKYYDRLLEKSNLALYEQLKEQRECALELSPNKQERSADRLSVRETVKKAQIGSLKRTYENG